MSPTAHPKRWLALGVMVLAAMMDLIDTTIVNVAIPSLTDDLGASAAAIEWIVAGYTLAFALGLITGGRLGDIYGRRLVFVIGVAGFTVASLASGLAPTAGLLIGARVVQGVFAALMVPQVLSQIQALFPAGERAKAYGLYGAAIGLSAVGGPLLGGLLIQADVAGLDWRPIFLINVPAGIAALVAALRVVPETRAEERPGLDLAGVGLLTVALMLLLYPLVEGRQLGWPAWTFAMIALSIPALALFARQQGRRAAAGGVPLVPPQLFRTPAFSGGVAVSLLFMGGIAVFFLMLSIVLQIGEGWSPTHLALTGLPFSLGIAMTAGLSGQLAPKLGRRLLMAGAVGMAAGMAGITLVIDADLTSWQLAAPLLVSGIGMGLVAPVLIDVVLAGVSPGDAGSASGVLNASFQLGGAIGVAAVGAVFFDLVPAHGLPGAMHSTMWILVGLYVLTVPLMLMLPRPGEAGAGQPVPAAAVG